MPSRLGYWKCRGLGQQIRYVLEYAGEDYEEKRYEWGPAPEYSGESWKKEKFTLGLDFPNVPYYMSGDVKLTQSQAILRHLGRKYNLYGSNANEQAIVDMLLDTSMDYRNAGGRVFYNPDFEKTLKEGYLKDTKERLQTLEKYGEGKAWFTGDNITIADFSLYDYLTIQRTLDASLFEGLKWINTFMDKIEALPAIKKYRASDKFLKGPINGIMAAWPGGEY